MTDQNCVFCKIIAQEIPATIIAQNDECIVIKDRAPKAPIHYLIIPRKHISQLAAVEEEDASVMAAIGRMARHISQELPGSQAFRFVINNGADAGQTVFHLHAHILAGKSMHDL